MPTPSFLASTVVVSVSLATLAGTAAAEPPGAERADGADTARPFQPDVYAVAGVAIVPFGVISGTVDAGYRLGTSAVWAKGHVARMNDEWATDGDEMSHEFTELGAGVEWRRCTWPGFACGAVGVMAAGNTGDGGVTVIPYVDGELGIGPLALRLGIQGRVGAYAGPAATGGIVVRY